MNKATEQTSPETLNDEIVMAGEKIFEPQNELPFPESEVDLNEVFPDEDNDLNDLFPDEETKLLLKKIQKNKKDLHTMTDRFFDDNWGSIENEEVKDKEPTKPLEVTDNS
jgi:hypothetical protein